MNPFAKASKYPVPPIPLHPNKVETTEEINVNYNVNNEFLSELRDFMNDFEAF